MKGSWRYLLIAALAAPILAGAQAGPGASHVPPPNAPPPPMQPLPEIKGVVSWNTLAKVKQIKTKDRILPEFAKEITALDNTEVKIQGFMMPLEPGEKQKHFLISLTPQSCSFCLPAGPEGVVEVKSKTPVKYTFEPVVLSGKMTVLKDDPMGLYYRLTEAAPVSLK
ncbi:DUF3299 domain-containing protein [Noviherbaspirillum denitrificans]|uniref:DUF3299 domain-containing protein n=1 Tax=Noviherbaspirillum denitrificans TaxID=1968433 RepID=A0A254T8A0_9BURK|nr:DUF3299 domain-containing protein [Noviherbaspirillum denitrificans]OWW18881.1 hypothetical protein AYR66_04665 [Noviherbaspirillum denitrificans]